MTATAGTETGNSSVSRLLRAPRSAVVHRPTLRPTCDLESRPDRAPARRTRGTQKMPLPLLPPGPGGVHRSSVARDPADARSRRTRSLPAVIDRHPAGHRDENGLLKRLDTGQRITTDGKQVGAFRRGKYSAIVQAEPPRTAGRRRAER